MQGDLHCQNCSVAPVLVQRPDDNEATVAERLRVYDAKTRPLVDYYRAQGLLRVISAEGEIDDITHLLVAALSAPEAKASGGEGAKPVAAKKPSAAKAKPPVLKAAVVRKPAVKASAPKKAAPRQAAAKPVKRKAKSKVVAKSRPGKAAKKSRVSKKQKPVRKPARRPPARHR
jgi:adenylate kinase